jgi:hypothetical protein
MSTPFLSATFFSLVLAELDREFNPRTIMASRME